MPLSYIHDRSKYLSNNQHDEKKNEKNNDHNHNSDQSIIARSTK